MTDPKPPSTDTDTNNKKKKRNTSGNNSGGQNGHVGATLEKTDDPDETKVLMIDRRTLPKGDYEEAGLPRDKFLILIFHARSLNIKRRY